jgi:diguanylate cyclase (GGDEF)-like protein
MTSRRYGRSFGLVLADLDAFKQLNDRYGHATGRGARRLAGVLAECLRQPDDAFRIGGDEFAMILAEATHDDARFVVSRINSLLENLSAGREQWLTRLSSSFGFASCPADAADPQTLFSLADEALYDAKRNGSGLRFVARA